MKKILIILVGLMLTVIICNAQSDIVKSQAIFLYNFTRYVQWPSDQIGSYYIIGVIGDSPVYDALKQYTCNKQVGGKPIRIQKCNTIEETTNCHMLFISDDKSTSMSQILQDLKGKSCLTVFENGKNSQSKAAIDFVREEQKLKYRVNEESASGYNIIISDMLVKMSI